MVRGQEVGDARHAFEREDRPLLEAVQQNMGDAEFWSLKPAMLTVDSGAVRVRRDELAAGDNTLEFVSVNIPTGYPPLVCNIDLVLQTK